MKIFLYTIIIIFTGVIYYGCGCSCGQASGSEIPDEVLKNADRIIINKTGEEFFEEYIKIDLNRSKNISPDYFLVYRLIMPEKPFVNETIEFTVDEKGNLKKEFSVKGIPECLDGDCDFSVDEAKAISIAEENGLDKGIKDWLIDFRWNEKQNKYVWHILSTLSASDNTQGGRSSGKEILIDANTGDVLEKNEWHVR